MRKHTELNQVPEWYCIGNSRRRFATYEAAVAAASALVSKANKPIVIYRSCAVVQRQPAVITPPDEEQYPF